MPCDGNDEIYLSVLPLSDLLAGAVLPAQRLTHMSAEPIGAYLSWNGARLAVVWCDAGEGQQELYAQMFDWTGKAHAAIRRLTRSPSQPSIPSVRARKDGFVIA